MASWATDAEDAEDLPDWQTMSDQEREAELAELIVLAEEGLITPEELAEARRYLEEGHFGAGSMAPKIEAALRFLEAGGRRAVITCPEELERALEDRAGTTLVP